MKTLHLTLKKLPFEVMITGENKIEVRRPSEWILSRINVLRLGEGGLVGCSILAECFCPLLPNPCYMKCRLI